MRYKLETGENVLNIVTDKVVVISIQIEQLNDPDAVIKPSRFQKSILKAIPKAGEILSLQNTKIAC